MIAQMFGDVKSLRGRFLDDRSVAAVLAGDLGPGEGPELLGPADSSGARSKTLYKVIDGMVFAGIGSRDAVKGLIV